MTRFPANGLQSRYKPPTKIHQSVLSPISLTHSVCHLLVLVSEISYLKYFFKVTSSPFRVFNPTLPSQREPLTIFPHHSLYFFSALFLPHKLLYVVSWIVYSFPDSYRSPGLQFLRIFDNIGGIIGA